MDEKLYNALVKEGYYSKSYQEFQTQFSDEGKRKKLHEGLQKEGFYSKSYQEFNGQFFAPTEEAKQPTNNQQPQAEQPENAQRTKDLYAKYFKQYDDVDKMQVRTKQLLKGVGEEDFANANAYHALKSIEEQKGQIEKEGLSMTAEGKQQYAELQKKVASLDKSKFALYDKLPTIAAEAQDLADLAKEHAAFEKKARDYTFEAQNRVMGKLGAPLPEAGQQIMNSMIQGFGTTFAAIPEQIGIAAKYIDNKLGINKDKKLEEYATYKAGTEAKKAITEAFPTASKYDESFWLNTIPQGLGQLASFAVGGIGSSTVKNLFGRGAAKIAGKASVEAGKKGLGREIVSELGNTPLGSMFMGSSAMATQEYKDAYNKTGGDQEKAFDMWLASSVIGAGEAIPITTGGAIIGKLGKAAAAKASLASVAKTIEKYTQGGFSGILLKGTGQGIEESLEEGLSQFAINASAREIYDATRELTDGVKESAEAGFVLGAIMGGFSKALKGREGENLNPEDKAKLKAAQELIAAKIPPTVQNATPEEEIPSAETATPEAPEAPQITQKLTDLQGRLAAAKAGMEKEGIPDSLKAALGKKYQSISDEIDAEEEAIKQATEASKTAKKQLTEEEQLTAFLNDPDTSEVEKEAAQEALDELQKQKQDLDTSIQENPKVGEVLGEMFGDTNDLSEFDDLFAQTDAEQAIAEAEAKAALPKEETAKAKKPAADEVITPMLEREFDKYNSAKQFFEANGIEPTAKQEKEVQQDFDKFLETADMLADESKRPKLITDRAEKRKKTAKLLNLAKDAKQSKMFNAKMGKELMELGYTARNNGSKVVLINNKGDEVQPIGYDPDEDADYAIPFEKRAERTQEIAKKLADVDIATFKSILGSGVGKTGLNPNAIKLAQKAFKEGRLNPSAAIAIDLIESRDTEYSSRGFDVLTQIDELKNPTNKEEAPQEETKPEAKKEETKPKDNPFIGNTEAILKEQLSTNESAFAIGFIEEGEYNETKAQINEALNALNPKEEAQTAPQPETKKEAWQMPFEEFFSKIKFSHSGSDKTYTLPNGEKGLGNKSQTDYFKSKHQKIVKKAIQQGENIPANVLDEYPNINTPTTKTSSPIEDTNNDTSANSKQTKVEKTEAEEQQDLLAAKKKAEQEDEKIRIEYFKWQLENQAILLSQEEKQKIEKRIADYEAKTPETQTPEKVVVKSSIAIKLDTGNSYIVNKLSNGEYEVFNKNNDKKPLPKTSVSYKQAVAAAQAKDAESKTPKEAPTITSTLTKFEYSKTESTKEEIENTKAKTPQPEAKKEATFSRREVYDTASGKLNTPQPETPKAENKELDALKQEASKFPKGNIVFATMPKPEAKKATTTQELLDNFEGKQREFFEKLLGWVKNVKDFKGMQENPSVAIELAYNTRVAREAIEDAGFKDVRKLGEQIRELGRLAEQEAKAAPQPEVKKSTIVNAELDNLWDEFNDIAKGKAYSGIDPQLLAIGTKLVGKYVQLGVVKFAEIVQDTYLRFGKDRLLELGKALKASYASYYTTSDNDDLTDIKEVRNFDIQNFINEQENGQEPTTPPIQQDTPKLPNGELSNKGTNNVSAEQIGKLPNESSTASGQEKSGTIEAKSERSGSGRDGASGDTKTVLGTETERQPAKRQDEGINTSTVGNKDINVKNHVIKDSDIIVERGDVSKLNANMNAFILLKKLKDENRNATPAEKQVLAKFSGWGGIGNKYLKRASSKLTDFIGKYIAGEPYTFESWEKDRSTGRFGFQERKVNYEGGEVTDFDQSAKNIYAIIKSNPEAANNIKPSHEGEITLDDVRAALVREMMTEGEFVEAENSTKNAHYTSKEIIKSLWNLAEMLGFKGGKVLESSAGIGHFFGLMPENLASKSKLTGIELESTTGSLLEKLYPEADIQVKGFEDAQFKDFGNVDLAITNVPFASEQFTPTDKRFPDISKGGILGLNLHNYMIAKNILALKAGGIGIFITSSSTLDGDGKSNKNFRTWAISEKGGNSDFMGAIRLPSNAFAENAGTQVTTDILIFRKRDGNPHPQNQNDNFVEVVSDRTVQIPEDRLSKKPKEGEIVEQDIRINNYYKKNPDNLLGEMYFTFEKVDGKEVSGSSYGTYAQTAYSATEVNAETLQKVYDTLPKDMASNTQTESKPQQEEKSEVNQEAKKTLVVNKSNGKKETAEDVYEKAYLPLKDKLLSLIKLEANPNASEALLETERKALNKLYDGFVYKYGNLTGTEKREGNQNIAFLEDDNYWSLVSSLESKKVERLSDGKINRIRYGKADILSKRAIYPSVAPETASNLEDAISISIAYKGKLDLPYLSSLTGVPESEIKANLLAEGLVYENPQSMQIELPEEYLSGFVREKLKSAQEAAKTNAEYGKNVAALADIIKNELPDVPFSLITIALGNTWIPTKIMESFADSLFGGKSQVVRNENAATNKWLVGGDFSSKASQAYKVGDRKVTPLDLLEMALNQRKYEAFDTESYINDSGNKSTKSVKNEADTTRGQEIKDTLKQAFVAWIKDNKDLHPELETLYNETFNANIIRTWTAPNIDFFPNANQSIKLRKHQKQGVRRGLSQSSLFAHGVGTGKTMIIQATAMEMRRLGVAKKPLIVVQNSTLEDFANKFRKLYPSAKLLIPSKKEMQAEGRKQLMGRISTGDWDAIILPQSQLDMIPDNEERKKALIYEKIAELEEAQSRFDKKDLQYRQIQQQINTTQELLTGKKKGKNNAKKQAGKNVSITNRMEKQMDRKTDQVLNFEEMGIDALLIDEAHEYKRLGFMTEMRNVKGIDVAGAKKSLSLMLKTRWIQEKKEGKNVLFYTGTPISNTMAELWTFLNYLRPDILQKFQMKNFDDFANNFGNVINSFEQRGSGDFKEVQRFAEYTNAPELMKAWLEIADVVLSDDINELRARTADEKWEIGNVPKLKDGKFTDIKLPKSDLQKKQTSIFRARLQWYDELEGEARKKFSWIPMVTFQEAKRATIDLRLLYGNNPELDEPTNKLNESVRQAYQIWKDSADVQGVQTIFCDAYKKLDFNAHREIKRKLVAMGIPSDQIEIMTESKYDNVKARETVFQKANEGKVRILIGRTSNMGVGVNIQNKMIALHHLDAPDRPMDFEQRNGRILRQGNTNEFVRILTYAVEETLDATSYKRLGLKQTFVNQAMKGEVKTRNMQEGLDDTEEFFKSFSAELAGDVRVVDLKKLEAELEKAKRSKAAFEKTQAVANTDLSFSKNTLEKAKTDIKAQEDALALINKHFPADTKINEIEIDGKTTKLAEQRDLYPILNAKIDELVQKYYDELGKDKNASPKPQAKIKINGMELTIQFSGFETGVIEDGENKAAQTRRLSYYGGVYKNYGNTNTAAIMGFFKSAEGFVQSFAGQKKGIAKTIENWTADIPYWENKIKNGEENLKNTFDDSKINDLQKEVNNLKTDLMQENGKKNEYNLPAAAISKGEALFFVLNKKKIEDIDTKTNYEINIDNSEEADERTETPETEETEAKPEISEVPEVAAEEVKPKEERTPSEPNYIQPLTKISEVKNAKRFDVLVRDTEGNPFATVKYDRIEETDPYVISFSLGYGYDGKPYQTAEEAFFEINRIIRAENKQIKDLYEAKNKTTLPENVNVKSYWDKIYDEIDTSKADFFDKYEEIFGEKNTPNKTLIESIQDLKKSTNAYIDRETGGSLNDVTTVLIKKILNLGFDTVIAGVKLVNTIDEARKIVQKEIENLAEKLKTVGISQKLQDGYIKLFSDKLNAILDDPKTEAEITARTSKLGTDKKERTTEPKIAAEPRPISGAGKSRTYGAMESVLDKEAFTEVLQDFIKDDEDTAYRVQKDSDLWQEIQDDFSGKTIEEQIKITENQLLEANESKNPTDKLVFQTYFLLHRLTDEANRARLEGDMSAYRQFGEYQGRLMTLVSPIGTEAGRIVRQFAKIGMAIRMTPAGHYEYMMRSLDRKREKALGKDKAGEDIEKAYAEAFSPEAHSKAIKIVADFFAQKAKDLRSRFEYEKKAWETSMKESIKVSKNRAEAEIKEGKKDLKSIFAKIMPKGRSGSASMSFTILPIDPDKLDTQTKPLFKALMKIAKGYVKLGATSALEVYHKIKGDLESDYDAEEIATIDDFVQAAALKSVGEKWKATAPEIDLLKKNEELLAEFVKNNGKDISQIIEEHYKKPDGISLATKLEARGLDSVLANSFAEQIEKEIDKRTRTSKEKALEKIYGGKSVASITQSWRKSRDKIVNASMKGITKEEFVNSFAGRYDFTSMTDEDKAVVKDYTDRISLLPNASEYQARLRRELATWLNRKDMPNKKKVAEALMELFYVGMLSSPITLYRNAKTLTAIMFTELPKGVLKNPKQAKILVKSMQVGASKGLLLFKQAVRDGIFDMSKEYHQMQEAKILETFLHNGDKRLLARAAKAYIYLPTMMYRILIGSDILFRETLQELRMQELAISKLKAESPKDSAFWQKFYEDYANNTSFEANATAHAQAVKDTETAISAGVKQISNKEQAIKRRFYEILESQANTDRLDEAKRWSAKKTLTGEPEGWLGWAHEKHIAPFLQKFKLGKLILPFTRVPSNIVNMWVENSALGLISAIKSYTYGTYRQGENQKISQEEYYDRLFKAGVATALHVLLLGSVLGDDEDEEDNFFKITGGGFSNYNKNKVLSQAKDSDGNPKWREYSINIGGTWISYKDLPLGMTLASVGELSDFIKYRSKEEGQELNLYTFAESMFNGLTFIKEQSYIKNIAELFEIGSQAQNSTSANMAEKGAMKAGEFTTKTVKTIAFANLYRFLYADVYRDVVLGEAVKDKQSPNLIFDEIEDKVALNFLNGLFQDTPFQDYAGASGVKYDPLGFEIQKDGFVQLTNEELLKDDSRRKQVWELLLSKRRFIDYPKAISMTDGQGKVRPMTRTEFVSYSNARGQIIKTFLEDNYKELVSMDDAQFKKLMSNIVSEATNKAKFEVMNK